MKPNFGQIIEKHCILLMIKILRRQVVMDKKGIRAIWYSLAVAFFLVGPLIDKNLANIFSPLACCCIYVGNKISSRIL